MIQRIQTIYLLLAAIVLGQTYWLGFGSFALADTTGQYHLWSVSATSAQAAISTLPLGILVSLSVILHLVTIVLFANRALQNRLNLLNIILQLGIPALAFFYAWQATDKLQSTAQYGIAFVLPLVSLILTGMAYSAIRKDEKLIRSLDRIR